MDVARWWVVDPDDRTVLLGGPYLWDGVAPWTPPETGRLVREDAVDEEVRR